MRKSNVIGLLSAVALLVSCGPGAQSSAKPQAARTETPASSAPVEDLTPPAGLYKLDRYHSSIVFRADHLGFSFYAGSFATFDAALNLDPANLDATEISASIDVTSLRIPTPPEGFFETLMGEKWFNADAYPEIRFHSTAVTQTSPKSARVDGVLTMLGATAPVSFDVEYRGGYAGYPQLDPNARIGFTASGFLNRSDFGLTEGIPPEGSNMGVFDTVTFQIDAEFNGPPLPEPAAE
ncbi:YceI family protein [Hyphococcus sp.]|uniref:YceI family protein n=1 Tax=Hyphococcus sp. TaxID=2038636 RepID=UPI00208960DB|nr:MAG: polyisoprenoid-binding protein [Marinicaulis sp.]